jgi:chaperone required for assembly of F1-ATPase
VKRFWTGVAVAEEPSGWGIRLDGKPLRTPARAALVVPAQALANAINDEWAEVGDKIDPRAMPLTGLANAAVDRVGADPRSFAAALARYAEADLTCYRAEGPSALVQRQAEQWDPLLSWARRRYDVDFATTTGIVHMPQPSATVRRLAAAVEALDSFRLAGLSPLVTIGGSLIAALAVLEGSLAPRSAWHAVSLDERWQLEQWGADQEAEVALASRERDFLAAARFIGLLD